MNMSEVTPQDCIDMYDMKEKYAVINDGKLIGFEKEIHADRKSEQG